MAYTPIFTSKATVVDASNNKVSESDITDTNMKFGENNVIRGLRKKGIEYTTLKGDDGTEKDWENNTTLEQAATYSVLCLLNKIGVKGSVPLSGPLTGATADGMSKSFGGAGSVSRKDIKSPFDWCEMSGNLIEDLASDWRADRESAKKESPGISRSNSIYDRNTLSYRRHDYR